MKKKYSLSTLISILFIAMTLTFCVTMVVSTRIFEKKVESVSAKQAMYDKISDIDSVVRQNFYTSVNDESIQEALSAGYIAGLSDEESRYLTVADVIEYQEIQNDKIIGVGLEFTKSRENNGYMLIYNVAQGSPADVEGIKAGDVISAIGGVSTINMTYETAKELLTGMQGDTVDISYISDGKETAATLTHKAFEVRTVSQQKIDDFGYIKISSFSSQTVSDLDYAINNLSSQNVTALIIDLRGNTSKEFEARANCADLILKEGTSMYAVYKDGEKKVLYTSDKNGISIPVVVVVNGETGYAAEMFAVMMKDSHSAKIVGTTTMGKGTLQKMYRLSDGSGIELTIAALSPVSSDSYNGTGIAPDYEKVLDSETESLIYTLSVEEDPQIIRAMEVAGYLAGVTQSADETVTETTETDSDETDESEESEDTENTDESSSEDTSSSEENEE